MYSNDLKIMKLKSKLNKIGLFLALKGHVTYFAYFRHAKLTKIDTLLT